MWDKEKQDFLEQLYRDHAENLRLYSYALLGKQPEFWPLAEDCVQQTFLKAMRQIHSLRQHGAPYLWLYKTCQYTTLTEMKTLKRRAKSFNTQLRWKTTMTLLIPRTISLSGL